MICIFDTETTGFVNPNLDPDDPRQCHLIQLAAQLVDPADPSGTVMEFSLIVNPGDVEMSKGAYNAHGISLEFAQKHGVSPSTAVDFFMHLSGFADIDVAHNIEFDRKVMALALHRRTGQPARLTNTGYCTMKAATNIVKSPPTEKMLAAGRNHFKSPNLGECIKHFFGEELEGAHDAMVDVRACRRVYFELQKGKST
jgi:DNA polymerase-3 subunit epsilon